MTGRMDGKLAIVTGGASGMGRAVTERFLQEGASVAILDLNEDALNAVVDELKPSGTVVGFATDISQADSVTGAVQKAVEALGGLDTVVNAAGILDGYANLEDTDEKLWDQIMNVDLKGTFLVTKTALPHLLKNDKSAVVNFSSIAGVVANGGGIAYTSAKHAVLGFTKQMAADYGKQGLRTNAVLPGAVETAMTNELFAAGDAAVMDSVNAVPAGRYAQPEEIANTVLFLASDEASFIHGATYLVDGGWTING